MDPNHAGYVVALLVDRTRMLPMIGDAKSNCVIYVKPENSDVPVLVPPGQTYAGDQDGYAAPCTVNYLLRQRTGGLDTPSVWAPGWGTIN